MKTRHMVCAAIAGGCLISAAVHADQVTGTPSATISIDGKQLKE